MRLDTLVIATRNPAKQNRYRRILSRYAARVMGLDDIGTIGKPEERGETAEENAEIKARFYAMHSGHAVFSEDEALYVDFLPGAQQPGVHVRRINHVDEASDEALLAHWERTIAAVPAEERTGKWHVAYSLAQPDGRVSTFTLDFPIAFFSPSSPIIIPGWPISSLEGPLALHKPYSELTEWEQHQINQRTDLALEQTIAAMW